MEIWSLDDISRRMDGMKQHELIFMKTPRMAVGRLKRLNAALVNIPREALSPCAWLLEDHMQQLLDWAGDLHLPRRFASRLPRGEKDARILECARALCWEQGEELDEKRLCAHLISWQKQQEWTLQELDFFSLALRCALMEKVLEGVRGCMREARLYKKAEDYVHVLRRGHMLPLPEDKELMEKIIRRLTQLEDVQGLKRLDEELGRRELSADKISRIMQEHKAAAQQRLSKAVLSLQQVQRIRFWAVRERVSLVYGALRENRHFERMDRESRAYYAACVQKLAREYCVHETAVARAATALAEKEEDAKGDTGYYLCEHPEHIARYLMVRKKISFIRKHREGLFVLFQCFPGAAAMGAALLMGFPVWVLAPVGFCAGECMRLLLLPLLRRLFPPRLLPRLNKKALPENERVLVVVPTLITGRGHMLKMARHISMLRAANESAGTDYMLLADFQDADQAELPGDEEILLAGRAAFAALQEQREKGGCFLLVRSRTRKETQARYMGLERKRGALNMLNDLIVDGETCDQVRWANFDTDMLKNRYAAVITLDADTFLPPGAVQKLLGAILHPLQKGRTAVIQPCMAVGADTVKTRAQWYLGGSGGLCMYGGSCQDVYQDLFGKGSFVGKGIYDPVLWKRKLAGKLPEGRLLSHDMIEGEYAGAQLAENIELYDGHPARLKGFLKRLHRWTRGDWQLLPFLLRRDLSLLSKYKIWDNLRRSLLPIMQVALFLTSAFLHRPLLALLAFPWPFSSSFWRMTLLPSFAWMQLDAIFRALWRQFVSGKHLLSWVTAAQTEGELGQPVPGMLFSIACGSALIWSALSLQGFWPLALAGLLWVISPLAGWWLDQPLVKKHMLTAQNEAVCKRLAAETWHFFETFVTEETHFLPPDNVQLSPDKGAAMRTSPTNVGLYLLSCAAAREMQLISGQELGKRLHQTVCVLEQMPVWHGIPYNWYDLRTLQPLADDYVSSVDAGNMAVCLLCTAQAARSHLKAFLPDHQSVPARLDRLFDRMQLDRLYDPAAGLFWIGCNGKTGEMDSAHYDMLGSEARLTSFAAIVKNQAPAAHFARLNRTMVRAGGGAALLSWGGTMFEYLLPQLLLPMYPGTLMDQGCRNAVRAQMSSQEDRPWGISESGYAEFDPELNYQYRAFGLPVLAKSGQTAGQVTAPYASVMALPFFPNAAAENIRRMRHMGWYSQYGLYEAADYTPSRMEGVPRLVQSHMAHHQGMILCSLCNAMTDFSLVRLMCRIPRVQAHLYLLTERAFRGIPRRRQEALLRKEQSPEACMRREGRDRVPADVQLMGFQDTAYVVNSLGQGMIKTGSCLWTPFRWAGGGVSGPQTYVWDERSRRLILPCEGRAQFETGSISFSWSGENLLVTEKRALAPLTGALLVYVTLENRSDQARDVEVTSYLEAALHDGAKARESQDLGVSIRRMDERVLLAQRTGGQIMLGHMAAGNGAALHAQTDRAAFWQNSGDFSKPASLLRAPVEYDGSSPCPCLSFRMRMTVPPGASAVCAFVTAAASAEEDMQRVLLSYESLSAIREALLLARTASEMRACALQADAHRQDMYLQLLSAAFQTERTRMVLLPEAAANMLSTLGEKPLMAVQLGSRMDALLMRHVLRAHTWYRLQGIWVDTVILYDRETGYQKNLQEQVMRMIQASGARQWLHAPGGIHPFSVHPDEKKVAYPMNGVLLKAGAGLQEQLEQGRRSFESMEKAKQGQMPDCGALESDLAPGGFREDGAYQVVASPPVPWHHGVGHEGFGTWVTERGILKTWYQNHALGCLTRENGDACMPVFSEELLIKTKEGLFSLLSGLVAYEPGAAVYEAKCGTVQSKTEVFVHPRHAWGYRRVSFRTSEPMAGTLIWRIHFQPGSSSEVRGNAAEIHFASGREQAYAAATEYTNLSVSGAQVCFEQSISLQNREKYIWCGGMGCGNEQEMQNSLQEAKGVLQDVRKNWQKRLGLLMVYTMDEALDRMVNIWMPYQLLFCRLMARGGPYARGGAAEFGAHLQDALALLYTHPEWLRHQILLCAAHQYENGDVQCWWHAQRQGLRVPGGMDAFLLPYAVGRYVEVTGDQNILHEQIAYLQSPPLSETEKARYETPDVTPGTESLMQHVLRGMGAICRGKQGMLIKDGEENTVLTLLGVLGMRAFSRCCDEKMAMQLQGDADALLKSTQNMWNGKWYQLKAGEQDSSRVTLLPQCLAAIAGAPRHQCRKALEHVWNRLFDGESSLVKSMDPPDENHPFCVPFLGENGGQKTEEAVLLASALCTLGEGERAWEVYRALLPDRHTDTREKVQLYQMEPYVIAGEVYAGAQAGRGGKSWYTPGAAGMYRVLLEDLLGFRKNGEMVTLCPQKGFAEKELTLIYRYGQAVYHLTADRHAVHVTLDGKRQEEGYVLLSPEKGTHEARFPMHRYG